MEPVPAGVSARGHPERREGEQHPHPTEKDQGTPSRGQSGDREAAVRVGVGTGTPAAVGDPGGMRGWRGGTRGPTRGAAPPCRRGPSAVRGQPSPAGPPALKGPPPSALKATATLSHAAARGEGTPAAPCSGPSLPGRDTHLQPPFGVTLREPVSPAPGPLRRCPQPRDSPASAVPRAGAVPCLWGAGWPPRPELQDPDGIHRSISHPGQFLPEAAFCPSPRGRGERNCTRPGLPRLGGPGEASAPRVFALPRAQGHAGGRAAHARGPRVFPKAGTAGAGRREPAHISCGAGRGAVGAWGPMGGTGVLCGV